MILKREETEIISSIQGQQFGIESIDAETFVQMLLMLYSDITGSIVRELVSNAIDSQQIFGSTSPVVVGISGNLFFVQDWGEGLSEEFMLNKYTAIGYSTKRDSSEQIGYWGYGN